MTKTISNLVAAGLLIFMVAIAFFSLRGDSAIMDEVAHLPAGYSYIAKHDMRLNPEHPPLIKDLAGGAVWLYSKISGLPISFPDQIAAWQKDVNSQWDFGFDFLYKEGNDADLMLLWGRLPMLMVLLILGIYIFRWARQLLGPAAALLALFLYAFSPTFLAHGRYVTTDVAAAAGVFIASYYFIRWLKAPTAKNLIIAGLVFGLAQLAKFSVFLLVPLFGFIALLWFYLKTRENTASWLKNGWQYLGGTVLLMAVGYIFIVWPVYIFHVANYPVAKQVADTQFILQSFQSRFLANFIIWLAGQPILRAIAQYGLGLAMVLQRATGGNTAYFLGEISNTGSRLYFPIVYLLKETLTLHILTLIALGFGGWQFIKNKFYRWSSFHQLLKQNIDQVLMLCFIALYWYSSLSSILNIGVRHILPTFPFVFLLVTEQVKQWLLKKPTNRPKFIMSLKFSLVALLILWQAISVVKIYPSFLAYFNELIGGPANGYKYVTDSNLDWGQDLKRLAQWVKQNKVDKIYVEYFGGSTVEYYLDDKFSPWWGQRSPQDLNEKGGYLALSATFLQGGRGKLAPGFYDKSGYYNWLNNFEPLTVIGHSIFVYYIPPESIK